MPAPRSGQVLAGTWPTASSSTASPVPSSTGATRPSAAASSRPRRTAAAVAGNRTGPAGGPAGRGDGPVFVWMRAAPRADEPCTNQAARTAMTVPEARQATLATTRPGVRRLPLVQPGPLAFGLPASPTRKPQLGRSFPVVAQVKRLRASVRRGRLLGGAPGDVVQRLATAPKPIWARLPSWSAISAVFCPSPRSRWNSRSYANKQRRGLPGGARSDEAVVAGHCFSCQPGQHFSHIQCR